MLFALLTTLSRVGSIAVLCVLAALVLPSTAAADTLPPPNDQLLFSGDQVVVLIIGSLTPLAAYVLNHHLPFIRSERVKGLVHLAVAAVAAALYKQLETGQLGLNSSTLNLVVVSVAGALLMHNGLYRPAGINTALGGGSNAPRSG